MVVSNDEGTSMLQSNITAAPHTMNYENMVRKEEQKYQEQIREYSSKAAEYRARASTATDPEKRDLYATRAQRYEDALSALFLEERQ